MDEYWFENLKLRSNYKKVILDYIKNNYHNLYLEYVDIYINGNMLYWNNLSLEIQNICDKYNLKSKIFFAKKANEENKITIKQGSFKLF